MSSKITAAVMKRSRSFAEGRKVISITFKKIPRSRKEQRQQSLYRSVNKPPEILGCASAADRVPPPDASIPRERHLESVILRHATATDLNSPSRSAASGVICVVFKFITRL
jgi:hypothetical protein